jgi:hypothetical protein
VAQHPPQDPVSQAITAAQGVRFVVARVGSFGWVAARLLPRRDPWSLLCESEPGGPMACGYNPSGVAD